MPKKKPKTPSYILTLRLNTNARDIGILNKRFEIARKLYNAILNEGLKRYRALSERKKYRSLKKKITQINKEYHNCKDKNKLKILKSKRNNLYKELKEFLAEFGFNEYSLINDIKPMYKRFSKNIDNKTAQALATRAFRALEKVEVGKARKVKFKKYDQLNSIEGKWNKSGIKYREGYIKWNKLKIPVIIRNNDTYVQTAIQDKVKYCRIKREYVKGKYTYYVQLVLEGIPPKKNHKIGTGDVGIDIGTQTIAYSSQKEVKLLELAPEINSIDKQIKLLQRKMDRSKRVMNPNKYNQDGTIKKSNRDKWIFSNNYKKIRLERKELYRKQREIRKQSHEKLANHILSLGDKIYVEDMNYKGLQRRSKKTTKNKFGKYNKKKRFGKSLTNKAPSMFLTILDNKLNWTGRKLSKINTKKVKASQYNHITDTYDKKELKERWNKIKDYKIQRDLYSAFLIMNVKNSLDEVDRNKCIETFENFKALHDNEILRIKNNNNNNKIASMGI